MAYLQTKHGFAYDLTRLAFDQAYNGSVITATSSVFYISHGGGTTDLFGGYGFAYNAAGLPSGGVVTSYQAVIQGRLAISVTKVGIPVSSVLAVAQTPSNADDIALFRAALSGADTIIGDSGADLIDGFNGKDILKGQGGNDRISGGNGDDFIFGGAGRDILSGGSGHDRFRFEKISDLTLSVRDTIRDFKHGADKIDLSRIDADRDTAGNQAFKFIGNHAFSGHDGELRFAFGTVQGDVNGDGRADFAIRVLGSHALTAKDFYL